MRIPLQYICRKCNREGWINLDQEQQSFHYTCECGHDGDVALSNDYTIGVKILYRSQYELHVNKDYSLSIVLSAMAFECELSRLFFKWTELDKSKQGEEISNEELEKLMRSFRNITIKIDEVAKLMNSKGINDFVRNSREFTQVIGTGFPSLDINNLSKSFQEKLFWPRNRVFHLGHSGHNENDALRCFNISSLGIELFNQMDKLRQSSQD